jgi:hypothetical protein
MGARWDEDAAHGVVGMDDFGGFVVHVGFPIGVVFIVEKKDGGSGSFRAGQLHPAAASKIPLRIIPDLVRTLAAAAPAVPFLRNRWQRPIKLAPQSFSPTMLQLLILR